MCGSCGKEKTEDDTYKKLILVTNEDGMRYGEVEDNICIENLEERERGVGSTTTQRGIQQRKCCFANAHHLPPTYSKELLSGSTHLPQL